METVKVDVQKLHLLNERIEQAIDALNQLRLSAHGVAGATASPYSVPSTYGFSPYGTYSPYGAYHPIGFVQPGFSPFAQPPFAQPTFAQPAFAQPGFAQPPFWTMPIWGSPHGSNGTSHAWRPEWQARAGQPWPYASASE